MSSWQGRNPEGLGHFSEARGTLRIAGKALRGRGLFPPLPCEGVAGQEGGSLRGP